MFPSLELEIQSAFLACILIVFLSICEQNNKNIYFLFKTNKFAIFESSCLRTMTIYI